MSSINIDRVIFCKNCQSHNKTCLHFHTHFMDSTRFVQAAKRNYDLIEGHKKTFTVVNKLVGNKCAMSTYKSDPGQTEKPTQQTSTANDLVKISIPSLQVGTTHHGKYIEGKFMRRRITIKAFAFYLPTRVVIS